jgi:hypothetical protein
MTTTRATTSTKRPGMLAYEESVALPFAEIVTRLRGRIGVKLVAYIGNVGSTRPVASWADGKRSPGQLDEQRLRTAYQIAGTLGERYTATTTQTWFRGLNPALEYMAPARMLRQQDPNEVGPLLLAAASSFAYVG